MIAYFRSDFSNLLIWAQFGLIWQYFDCNWPKFHHFWISTFSSQEQSKMQVDHTW